MGKAFGALTVAMALVVWSTATQAACDPSSRLAATTTAEAPRTADAADRIARMAAETSYEAIGFGDSIMFGWPPDLLSDALGGPVLNASIGGASQTVIWQLASPEWSRQTPRYILLLTGTNNIGHGGCAVYWGVREAAAMAKRRFPTATVIVTSILPRGRDLRDREDDIAIANSSLKDAAVQDSYTFLDAHDAFLCDHHTPCPLFNQTNLHLTQAGYIELTRLLRQLLGRI